MNFEPIAHRIPGLRETVQNISLTHFTNAIIAFLFAASAPVAIVLGVGVKGDLSEQDIASWLFGAFVINGILGIIISILYRQPLVFFWTISGTVLVGPALDHLSFSEVIGAFYGTGILLIFLGITGWFKKIMSILPMPIIMAMVAGVFLGFGLDMIIAFTKDPWISIPMTLTFVLLSLNVKVMVKLPPMIGVLIVGIIAIYFTETMGLITDATYTIITPQIYTPVFSWAAIFELVVPLAVTVLAAQNAQGIAILRNKGHKPPVNTITAACGLGSILTATFGSVSTCLTGPVNAIISSSGSIRQQYIAAIIICILAILFGLYAPLFTKLMLATPPAFIATLAGLALLRVLESAFVTSFEKRHSLGALVCFLVTVADQSVLNIGAPFWGLVSGLLISRLLERNDFHSLSDFDNDR